MLTFLYHCILWIYFPFFLMRVFLRQKHYPEISGRIKERLGYVRLKLKNPIWIHAVSYGEAVIAERLILALREKYPDTDLLITTTTPTGALRIKKTLQKNNAHLFLPYDLPIFIRRFLKKIQPRLLIIMETELWPTLLAECKKRNVPILLANARLSEKSTQGYQHIRSLVQRMLNQLSGVAAQTQLDADRFLSLGLDAKKSHVMGSIKFDISPSEMLIGEGKKLGETLGKDRFVWIAASTHEGEEDKILNVFKQIKKIYPDSLLVLVPRHPERFEKVATLCEQTNYNIHRRSVGEVHSSDKIDIFLGDTLGELPLFYAASDVAFVGGSLMPIGGHNVLEPMQIGIPVIIGKHFFNFTAVIEELRQAGAIKIIVDESELTKQLLEFKKDPSGYDEQVIKANQFIQAHQGSVDKHVGWIGQFL